MKNFKKIVITFIGSFLVLIPSILLADTVKVSNEKDLIDAIEKNNTVILSNDIEVKNTIVVNIFAQKNFGYDGKCYTNYSALRKGLETVRDNNKEDCIAIPYLMGCHRGGGDWNIVSSMIEEILSDCDVTLYEYNGG